MDTLVKLKTLGAAAQYDVLDPWAASGEAAAGPATGVARDLYPCISHVAAPGGRRAAVLKVLQTNACRNNCRYCAFRAGRDYERVHLTSDELAFSFDRLYRCGAVQGIFLSSGIGETVRTMDEMLATAELLRGKYAFHGYMHLKLLPGVQAAQVERAIELADRVSTNLEAPDAAHLAELAPQKRLAELVGPLQAASQVLRRQRVAYGAGHEAAYGGSRGAPSVASSAPVGHGRLGMSTQFVVGPAGESDRDLLGMAAWLYREVRLTRAYYSAFRPIDDTPFEDRPATEERREFRLYQADWLLRYYGFGVDELPFDGQGSLRREVDPKSAWARQHPERFPIEVNRAPVAELMRVPGIGPASARAIVAARRQARLLSLGDLRRLGARADQAAPYVLLAGRRPPYQPPLPYPGAAEPFIL